MAYRLKRGFFTEVNGVPVTKRAHPNRTRGWGTKLCGEGIVFHYTVGCQPDIYTTLSTRGISCHFNVGLNGEIFQYVSLKDRAWHADNANDHYYGIEHAAFPGRCELTDKQLEVSAKLSAAIVEWAWRKYEYTIPLVHARGPALVPGFKDHRDGDGVLWNFNRHTDHLYGWTWSRYLGRVQYLVYPYTVYANRKDGEQRSRDFRDRDEALEWGLRLLDNGWRVTFRKWA